MSDQPPSDPSNRPPPPPPPPSYGSAPSQFGSPPPPPPPPPPYGAAGYAVAGTGGPLGMTLAEWPIRAAAYVIDFVILAVAGFILGLILPDSVSGIVGLLLGVAYYGYMNGELGQTVGKQVMKIKVVHMETGEKIGVGMAIARYLVWVVLFIACVIPGIVNALFPLWDAKKQTLHDKVTKSQVVMA